MLQNPFDSIGSSDNSSVEGRHILAQPQANGSASPSANLTATDFLTYDNSTLGIRALYPSNWTIEHYGSNVSFVPPQGFESLVLSVGQLLTNSDLLDMINAHVREQDLYRSGPMGREGYIIELTPTLISDGIDAYRFAYRDVCMPDLKTCYNLDVWAIHGDKIYKFRYSTFGDNLNPTVGRIIDSFRIVN